MLNESIGCLPRALQIETSFEGAWWRAASLGRSFPIEKDSMFSTQQYWEDEASPSNTAIAELLNYKDPFG